MENQVRNEIFRQMSLTSTLPLDVPVHPMDAKGVIIIIINNNNNDNNNNLGFIQITMERPFFQKKNSQALLLNIEITHTLTLGGTLQSITFIHTLIA